MNTNIHPGRKHMDVKNPSLRKELRDGSVTGVMTGVNFNTVINPDIRSGFDPGDEVSEITGNHSSLYPVTSEVSEEVSPVSEEVSNANEVNAPSDIQIHGMVETNRTGNTREMTGSSSVNINDTAYGNISDSGSKKISGNNTGDIPKTIKREQVAGGIEDIHDSKNAKPYVFPPVKLLSSAGNVSKESGATLKRTAEKLEVTLRNFGINVKITDISCGPAVTRFEITPELGVKVSKIVNLADDIKLNLAAADIRIEAPIPGKAAVGIEVPNSQSVAVSFRELVESEEFKNAKSKITFAVGKDIAGKVKVTDIAKMPHLLIAGATGSGKSVCINTIIMSILYKAKPDEVKLIMIDPKVVELSVYNGIPHLMIPVVTDPKKAAGALNWAVSEMTDRYEKFANSGVREINGYNAMIDAEWMARIQKNRSKMPQIVIIVDELADLMMVCIKGCRGGNMQAGTACESSRYTSDYSHTEAFC
jgi:S-DNA-T family DNA segregation ATPase FtsK/SpoIIIE